MLKVGSYSIETVSHIGKGSFGVVDKVMVYNADGQTCKHYAMKTFSINNEKYLCLAADFKKRFNREVIHQSKCSNPYVIPIALCDLSVENPFFVMELGVCDLNSLADNLHNNVISDEEKIDVIEMLAKGLFCIHDKDFLHRDINPKNIIKCENGDFKLSDFGLVKNTSPHSNETALTEVGVVMGTMKYIAPEVEKEGYSKQSDIFSLGQVMLFIHVSRVDFQRIVMKCIAPNKNARYETVEDILSDIEKIKVTIEEENKKKSAENSKKNLINSSDEVSV